MTVYELIEKLQSFNQDMEVIVHDNRWDENLDIVEVEYSFKGSERDGKKYNNIFCNSIKKS